MGAWISYTRPYNYENINLSYLLEDKPKMDIKEFKKNVRNSCKFIAPTEKRKECNDIFMCNWNNCNKEQIDFASTRLTDADRKSCKNKNVNKY